VLIIRTYFLISCDGVFVVGNLKLINF